MTHLALSFRYAAAAALALAAVSGIPTTAQAGDSITIGKAVPTAWTFTPADIGIEKGFFKKHGFDNVKTIGFGGDAKLQQALLSKDIDFGLASGPGMAFNAKGGGGFAVAAYYGAPRNLGVSVKYEAKTTLKDLKGGKLAVSTPGSLTFWLTQRLSKHLGWGVEGITPIPVGGPTHTVAAVETGKVEGGVASTEMTLQLERDKRLKQIYNFAKLVPHFITHVIEARKDLVKDKPDMVRRFVAAWFETTEWMYGHKKESVQISAKVLKQPEDLMAKIYDFEMPEFSHTGKFDPEAVALLKESFIEQKRLDTKPSNDELFTEKFLPKTKAKTH